MADEETKHMADMAVLEQQKAGENVLKLAADQKDNRDRAKNLEVGIWHDIAYVYISLLQWHDAEVCISKSKAIKPLSASRCHAIGKCDYFNGDWVPNPSGPVYTNDSCDLIEPPQNCLKNGRPDRDFLYWRWAPREYDLPQFDPHRFLNLMRNKAWALIGDSISRNHVQSLVCILSKGLIDLRQRRFTYDKNI